MSDQPRYPRPRQTTPYLHHSVAHTALSLPSFPPPKQTAFKFSDLEAMDESAADEVLLSKVFSQLAAWKAAKKNATLKFSADAVTADAADDEVRGWEM